VTLGDVYWLFWLQCKLARHCNTVVRTTHIVYGKRQFWGCQNFVAPGLIDNMRYSKHRVDWILQQQSFAYAVLITCTEFLVNWFRGYEVLTPQKCPFPYLKPCRSQDSVSLPCYTVIMLENTKTHTVAQTQKSTFGCMSRIFSAISYHF